MNGVRFERISLNIMVIRGSAIRHGEIGPSTRGVVGLPYRLVDMAGLVSSGSGMVSDPVRHHFATV